MTKHWGGVWLAFLMLGATASCGSPEPASDASAGSDTGGPGDAATDAGRDAAGDASGDAAVDASGDGGQGTVSTLVVAADGGTVTSADGLFEIYVFPGALAADTTISITRVATADVPADVAAASPISAVYSVEPDGLTFGGDGAWGHYSFPTAPAGAITPGTVPSYAAMSAASRPAAGGAITASTVVDSFYDAETGSLDVVARLEHLSLQFATEWSGAFRFEADLGDYEQIVGSGWLPTGLRVSGAAMPGGDMTVSDVRLWARGRASVVAVLRDSTGTPLDELRRAAQELGLDTFVDVRSLDLHAPPAGDPWSIVPPSPSLHCLMAGPGQGAVSASIVTSGGYRNYVDVRSGFDCITSPIAEVRISDTSTCRREGTAVVCDPPHPTGSVTSGSTGATTTVVAPDTTLRVTPPTATPAAGPPEVSATTGGTTLRATRETTGQYTLAFTPPDTLTFGSEIDWAIGSEHYTMPAPLDPVPPPTFGAVNGLDTDLHFDAAADERWRRQIILSINGRTPALEPYELRGMFFDPDTLPDGSTGVAAPLRTMLDAAATSLGVTTAQLTTMPFSVSLDVGVQRVWPSATMPVQVVASHRYEIDGSALLATCATGRTYCSTMCVDTATDPMNCGGCGVVGDEICDGRDNDCNGRVDERCPAVFGIRGAGAVTSPVFGTFVAGHGSASLACPTYHVVTGFRDRQAGAIWQLAPYCGTIAMRVDRTTVPYGYFLDVTPGATPGLPLGGGSTGGPTGTIEDRVCPPGMMVDGVVVGADTSVQSLQLRCAQWALQRSAGNVWQLVQVAATTMLPVAGGGTAPMTTWIAPLHSSGTPEVLNGGNVYYTPGSPLDAVNFTTVTASLTFNP